jgi:maltooligosyltrehalose trehalohydrolase
VSPVSRDSRLAVGAQCMPGEGVRFRAFAPGVAHLSVRIAGRGDKRPMTPAGDGWWDRIAPDARAGDQYCLVLEEGTEVPDPASRFQPHDVHGCSEVTNPDSYIWRQPWTGRAWEEIVLYELHIGTFTPEGTFAAAICKLDHLVRLGVTAVEIMPVADFPGRRNWGYDGVLLYAPDATYGRPEDFKRFVDEAHARGLAVILDVVYNHFGPEGNYLPRLTPAIFTERHHTPWGAAVNYDDAGCEFAREFVIHNALYWIEEFHLDGLRLDAVHAIRDDGDLHILDELAERVLALYPGRHVHLLLENECNEARRLASYRAQWNDDIHHVLHVAATGENHAYYSDFAGNTALLARALSEGFAFQGEIASNGKRRGQSSAHLPPTAFVSFIQNHDQIGNRAFGERIGALAPPAAVRAIAAVYLLCPQIPMLFMGEEWDARQPFLFFCDFHGELAEAVRAGRREEFKRFPEFADPQKRAHIPDPQSEATFAASKLNWDDVQLPVHAERLDWYRRVLRVRHARIVPLLASIRRGGKGEVLGPGAVRVTWVTETGGELRLAANLSTNAVATPRDDAVLIWHEGAPADGSSLAPWTVRWTLSDPP